jgi:hypothetical protein
VSVDNVVESKTKVRGTVMERSDWGPISTPYLQELEAAQTRISGIRMR